MTNCLIKDGKYYTNSGESSNLYKGLEDKFGSEIAHNLFVKSHSSEFKEQVTTPMYNVHNKEINNKLATVNPKVTEFKLGNETINVDKDLNYKEADVNGKKIFQIRAGEKGLLLGTMRTLPYKDGYKVDSVTMTAKEITVNGVKQGLGGIGLGSELYKNVINNLLLNGTTLYSDLHQTAPAKAIWEKFEKLGITETVDGRYKIQNIPPTFDSNGEIQEKYLLEFNKQQNATSEPLSFEQTLEVKNVLLSLPNIEDTDTLRIAMDKAFYDNGVFIPTYRSLVNSNLYTEAEINTILGDVSLQNKIKDSLDKLANTENIRSAVKEDAPEYKDYTSNINSFGKFEMNNPYLVEQDVLNNLDDLDSVESASFQEARSEGKVNLDEYREVTKKEINSNGELVDKKEQLIYANATKPIDDVSIIEDLETLLMRPEALLHTEAATNFTSKLQEKLKNYGIDINLVERMDLLPYLHQFAVTPSRSNMDALNAVYDGEIEVEVVKESKEIPLVHLDTFLNEKDIFDLYSLIKKEGNLYQKVEKINEDELREYLKEDTLSELDLYKKYLGIPLVTPEIVYDIPQTFEGNAEYLTTEFEADFNVNKLTAKENKEFYDLFKVDDRGITMVSDDPYSIQTVNDYLNAGKIKNSKDLYNYSLLSKNLPDLTLNEVQEGIYLDSKVSERMDAINNPQTLSEPKGNTIFVNRENFVSQDTTDTFVRTKDGEVFELIKKEGNLNQYVRVDVNQSKKFIDIAPVLGTELTISPLQFSNLESEIKKMSSVKELYNTKQLLDINLSNFDCV